MTTGHRYALPRGHRLGEYRIDRYLGSGGFGITYLATDENLNLQVAIKEYLPSDLAMRDADNSVVVKAAEDKDDFEWGRDRFLVEARSLARFDHPNIVSVQRFFEAHGTSYIVMDYVQGEALSYLLERKGTLTEAEIHQLVLPLADGLADIHGAGLLHRDIKPSNIIIRDDGTPVLIDFGSARQAVGLKSRTMTSVVTPGYAPLEQYAAKSKQGPATDIYAFGAVLYRCVTGKMPDDATERAIEDTLMPATQAAAGDYSKGLLAAIDAAMTLRVGDRPGSIATLLVQLNTFGPAPTLRQAAKESPNLRHDSKAAKRKRRTIWITTPLLTLALALAIIYSQIEPDSYSYPPNWVGKEIEHGPVGVSVGVGFIVTVYLMILYWIAEIVGWLGTNTNIKWRTLSVTSGLLTLTLTLSAILAWMMFVDSVSLEPRWERGTAGARIDQILEGSIVVLVYLLILYWIAKAGGWLWAKSKGLRKRGLKKVGIP